MNLRERLAAMRSEREAKRNPDWVRIMHQSTDDLRDSGIAARVPQPGSLAPDFVLRNSQGEQRRLRDWLDRGPLVLTFYRGVW